MSATVSNIAAYRFVRIEDPLALRGPLREWCATAGLKGTILLAGEGINAFLAGPRRGVEEVLERPARLARSRGPRGQVERVGHGAVPPAAGARQTGDRQPAAARFRPDGHAGAAGQPRTLRRWLDAGHDDERRPVALLDTRNAWEVALGSFRGALDPGITRFSQFAERLDDYAHLREHTIVTFCTGGIRCEKAAPLMRAAGFGHVHQLDGGILRWFEACRRRPLARGLRGLRRASGAACRSRAARRGPAAALRHQRHAVGYSELRTHAWRCGCPS
jgi:UPF0176 protein